MNPDQVMLIVIVSISAWTLTRIFRGPLGDAIARRIGGSAGHPESGSRDHEIAELQTRLAELEERLDFTERVLLQERQSVQLKQ
ncbi:MAG TPA: hypothetical protein VFN08_17175, partial [Gemmatimonadales bacterium]|nr:hypothetical protein [Gemmatimonadales bacterium]